MVVCHICKEEFKDNSGGQLTNHISNVHFLSKADYIILTELDGIRPICACGFCNERPTFYRGKFKEYAPYHDSFEWKEEQYIKKFGNPTCKTCGKVVEFHRGIPNKYCEISCRQSCWNQEKVKKTVKEKYGVDSIMNVKEFRDKCSKANREYWKNNYEENLNKSKKTSLERYGVEFPFQSEMIKEKQRMTFLRNYGVDHYSKTDKFRGESSKRMFENNPMKNVLTVLKCKSTQAKNNKWNSITEKYKFYDLQYQSSYEYDFLEFCERNNVLHLIKKSPTFRYLNKDSYHFPDYIFNNEYIIEIKSKWILDLQGGMDVIQEKIKSVESQNYKYLLILDKDYFQFEEIIK